MHFPFYTAMVFLDDGVGKQVESANSQAFRKGCRIKCSLLEDAKAVALSEQGEVSAR